MTLAASPNKEAFPAPWWAGAGSFTALTTVQLNATADSVSLLFQAPKAGDIDRFEFRINGVVTGSSLRCGLANLDETTSASRPVNTTNAITFTHYRDLTISGAGWQTPSWFSSDGADTGTRRTVTKGEKLAFCLQQASAGDYTVALVDMLGGTGNLAAGFPYGQNNTAAAFNVSLDMIACALYYSGETNATPITMTVLPWNAFATVALASNGTQNGGLRFRVPSPRKIDQVTVVGDFDGEYEVRLFDSDGTTVLGSATAAGTSFDKETRGLTSVAGMTFQFTSEIQLKANTTYRVAVKATTTTAVTMYVSDVDSNADLGAAPGGVECYWTQSTVANPTGTGDWSDTTTRVPFISLGNSAYDDGFGAGRAAYHLGI